MISAICNCTVKGAVKSKADKEFFPNMDMGVTIFDFFPESWNYVPLIVVNYVPKPFPVDLGRDLKMLTARRWGNGVVTKREFYSK